MSDFVKELDEAGFKQLILSGKPVLVDFWAAWCGPCKALAPFVDQVAEELNGQAEFGKVNVDNCMNLAGQYDVSTIPTLMVFKNGELLERAVGLRPKAAIAEMVKKHI